MSFSRFCLNALLVITCVTSCLAQRQTSVGQLNLTFTTIDVPGALYTNVSGINKAGDLVGSYGQNTSNDSHGFVYSNGVFKFFDYPGQTVTVPTSINDFGRIVGFFVQNPIIGFLFDGNTFTSLQDGTDSATFCEGINNAGVMVGGAGTIYTTTGFELRRGVYLPINFPGEYLYGVANGINNLGQVVGYTISGTYQNGFILTNGKFRNINFPGALETDALGINDKGVVVGWYNPSSQSDYAFILINGRYISFSYPGAVATFATGINTSGQIVGQYTFDYSTYHGFVTNPLNFDKPE
ncbi:MAG TPA: hypothetical protein VFA68_04825 [Terriglobales bacterium]|nr:hypothetical protein [Terriglobales bacterium]